jgi:hypothetical protein
VKPFLDWGIEVVLWFQQFSPTFGLPFKRLTFPTDLLGGYFWGAVLLVLYLRFLISEFIIF